MKFLTRLRSQVPLSLRGSVLLLGSLYLAFWPGRGEADLVASIIGFGFLVIAIILVLVGSLAYRKLKRNLRLSLGLPEGELVSRTPHTIVANLKNLSIPPLFSITLQLKFEEALPTTQHVLRAQRLPQKPLVETVTFPHRGEWRLRAIECGLSDLFGITSFQWNLLQDEVTAVPVYAPLYRETGLPVVSSSFREGDTVILPEKRVGDLLDIKPYHPADGMRRILWKLYAKSGELLSRHPEAAMVPEGKVIIYVLAGRDDDTLASVAHAYMTELDALGLDVCCGVEGGKESPLVVRTPDAVREALMDRAMNAYASSKQSVQEEMKNFLSAVMQEDPSARVSQILLFVSRARAATQSGAPLLGAAAAAVNNAGIKPVLFIPQDPEFEALLSINRSIQPLARLSANAKALLFDPYDGGRAQYSADKPHATTLQSFLGQCAHAGWEVV
jgi:hypothetical protein